MNFLAAHGSLAPWRLHVLDHRARASSARTLANHHAEITTAIAALFVGIVVGITGMGGGALMTPALIFLGVGNVSSIVTRPHRRGNLQDRRSCCALALRLT